MSCTRENARTAGGSCVAKGRRPCSGSCGTPQCSSSGYCYAFSAHGAHGDSRTPEGLASHRPESRMGKPNWSTTSCRVHARCGHWADRMAWYSARHAPWAYRTWPFAQALCQNHPRTVAMVWCGVVWCGVVCCGVVWCGVVCQMPNGYSPMGESLHCALLLDYVPPEEPPSKPLGNALRIR